MSLRKSKPGTSQEFSSCIPTFQPSSGYQLLLHPRIRGGISGEGDSLHFKRNRRKVLPRGSGRLRDPAVGKTLRKSMYSCSLWKNPSHVGKGEQGCSGGAHPELLSLFLWVPAPLCSWEGSRAGMELHLQQQRIPLQSDCDSVPMNHSATLPLKQILGFIIVTAGGKGGGEGKQEKKTTPKNPKLQCFISL